MTPRQPRPVAFLGIGLLCAALPAAAQTSSRTLYERYTEPIELYTTGLGAFTRPISSSSRESQAFFDQIVRRGRRVCRELGALGHLDPVVALLINVVHPSRF